MKKRRRRFVAFLCALLAALAVAPAWAGVPGSLTTVEGDRTLTGVIHWKPAARKYAITITTAGRQQIETELAPEQIATLRIAKPSGFDEAVRAVQDGRGEGVIATLDKIARDYAMLQWDEPATRWLVEAHMQRGDAAAAIRAAERIVALRPEAGFKGEMAVTYWQALLKSDRTAKLEDLIEEAIKSGSREAAAHALIMRGDLILKRGDSQENLQLALRDGYLRVITLFRAVRAAQPEALYKTAKALEKLGHTARAGEQMDVLRRDFAASEWARKP